MKTKRCACGETDPEKFYERQYYQCKACCKAYSKRWFQNLRKQVAAARKAYQERKDQAS